MRDMRSADREQVTDEQQSRAEKERRLMHAWTLISLTLGIAVDPEYSYA